MKSPKSFFVFTFPIRLLLSSTTMAQNWEWSVSAGGKDVDYSTGMVNDTQGNIYVTGIFGSTASFHNKTIKSKGKADIFLAKYTTDGDLSWIKRAGGSERDEATAVTADANGNAYITGWFTGLADFDKSSLISDGDDDIFIAMYNSMGDVVWVKQAGGFKGVDRSYGITVDVQGNSFVTGSFNGTAKFSNIMLKSVGTDDSFLAKYDNRGSVQWVKQSSGKNGEIGRAIAMDATGNIFICGDYNATFMCNSTQNCVGDWDTFIVKYDLKGNVMGTNRAGGEGYDRPIAMCIDKDNNCYVTGVYEKSCLFGKNQLTNQGNSDIFIAKTSSFDPIS